MADFFEHILVPTDFGAAAWSAFRRACDLGRPLAARLTLLHVKPCAPVAPSGLDAIHLLHSVLRTPPSKNSVTPTLWPKVAQADPDYARLADIADSDWSLGVEIETMLTQGDVATEILRIAANLAATLIVMGARAHGGAVSGRDRVIDKVLRASTGPVMLVPGSQPKTAKERASV